MKQIKELSKTEEMDLIKKCNHFFLYENGSLFWKAPKKRATIGNEVGSVRPDGYRHLVLDQRTYFTHHIVWMLHTGEYPKINVDHIDGDITNNKIENLRLAEQWQNRGNSSGKKGKKLPIGVHKTKSGRYMAIFRNQHIITTDSLIAASNSYQIERNKYYGEFTKQVEA